MSDVPTRQLGGKVAVVTGGTQGLGEAVARLFADARRGGPRDLRTPGEQGPRRSPPTSRAKAAAP